MAMDFMEMHNKLNAALKEIDAKLDSLDGNSGARKSEVIDQLIEAAQPNWSQVANQLVGQLAQADTDQQIGFFYGLVRALNKQYNETANKAVDAKVESMPKPTPLISPDQVPEITEQRKEVYKQIKALMDLTEMLDPETFSTMEKPRRRGGAPKGKRGKRAISFVEWTIGGKSYAKLGDVVELYPQYTKVADLTKAIKEEGLVEGQEKPGVNLTDPPAEFSFRLPDGQLLLGVNTQYSSEDDDETAEDDGTDDTGEDE